MRRTSFLDHSLWRGRVGAPRPVLLFSTYIFVRIEVQWSEAARAPGVKRLVDRIIEELRRREGPDGFIQLPKKPPPAGLRRGDRVHVIRGAFQGLSGLYQRQASHERVKILLSLLGASRMVELPSDDVERPQRRARRRRRV